MAVSMQSNVYIASRKALIIADLKSVMRGAKILRNTLNKVSSNSEDTKPFFFVFNYPFISFKLLLL